MGARTAAAAAGLCVALWLTGCTTYDSLGIPQSNVGPYQVRIHLLEASNYKPWGGAWIEIQEGNPDAFGRAWVLETDEHGVATLHMPSPPPKVFMASGYGGDRTCSMYTFCLEPVLAHGVAAKDYCWKPLNPTKPEPHISPTSGDLYIFVHKISWWSWGWHETFGGAAGPFVKLPPWPTAEQCPAVTSRPAHSATAVAGNTP